MRKSGILLGLYEELPTARLPYISLTGTGGDGNATEDFWTAFAEGGKGARGENIDNNPLWPWVLTFANRANNGIFGNPALWALWAASLNRGGGNAHWPCVLAAEADGTGGTDARFHNIEKLLMQAQCDLNLAQQRFQEDKQERSAAARRRAEAAAAKARQQDRSALPSAATRRKARHYLINAAQDLVRTSRDLDQILGKDEPNHPAEPSDIPAKFHNAAIAAADPDSPAWRACGQSCSRRGPTGNPCGQGGETGRQAGAQPRRPAARRS